MKQLQLLLQRQAQRLGNKPPFPPGEGDAETARPATDSVLGRAGFDHPLPHADLPGVPLPAPPPPPYGMHDPAQNWPAMALGPQFAPPPPPAWPGGVLRDGVPAKPHEVVQAIADYLARPSSAKPPPGCAPNAVKLFVGNIPKHCTEAVLHKVFACYGVLVEIAVVCFLFFPLPRALSIKPGVSGPIC